MFNQFLNEESGKKFLKLGSFVLALLALFLLMKILIDFRKIPNVGKEIYPQSTIMVVGEGESYAIPDVASFSFSVNESGESVSAAQDLLNAKVNKALNIIKESGVAESDIKTTSYNVYPKYEWEQVYCITLPCPQGKNKLIGYEVNQTIFVKVRESEKAGDLVSKIGAVNVSNISGIEFTVDNKDKYVAEAREMAIKKAKEQAKILAKQLGVRLGKMMYYNENGNYMPTPFYGEMGMGGDMKSAVSSAPANLPKGETKITSQVNITYEVK